MHIDEFDFDLPEHLIAQEPAPERDLSRLLVVRRDGLPLAHHVFRDLPSLLNPGDLLVLNDTRVMPARLIGRRARTGGKWEGLFLCETPDGAWELLTQTRGRLLIGETIFVDPETPESADAPPLRLRLTGKTPSGRWLAQPEEAGPAAVLLTRYGRTPLPPYIRKGRAAAPDRERYQTVYAREAGAVAAPTAGLHFTPRLFEELHERGVEWTFVTLHVGAGTFHPVTVEDVTQHVVQPEWGEVPAAAAESVAACKARGRRVVSVGTTSVRVLETAALASGEGPLQAWSGWTDLTIRPPFPFRVVDALITNFHLPRSSLLLLTAAFAGLETVRSAYKLVVEREYRFYSYGDAMLIL